MTRSGRGVPEIYRRYTGDIPEMRARRYAAAFSRHGRPSANYGSAGPSLAWPDGLTREEAGLPQSGFVFATFNQLYKVQSAYFDAFNDYH